jgi:2-oxoglutarate ferredoxin oxidoreductase subunit beta
MNLTILMFDNKIYALTKAQTSPTTKRTDWSNTHPQGSPFVPVNPIPITLGIPNVSFVAQTVDWNPPHLYQTIRAAHKHQGASFVRIFQRCPHYTASIYESVRSDSTRVLLLRHANGISVDETVARFFSNQIEHDPADLAKARELADIDESLVIGLFYRNPAAERYDGVTATGLDMSPAEKLRAVEHELDHFSI